MTRGGLEQSAEAGRIAAPAPPRGAAMARNSSLDVWRCIACLMIYFFHKGLYIDTDYIKIYGHFGVHMFFVLSGYLLSMPFLGAILDGRPLPSWGRYSARRFLRIYPPYVASLALYLTARIILGDKLPDRTNLLGHILLIFNYFGDKYYYSINAVYWSLAIEAQFYVLLPAVCWASVLLSPRRPGAAVKGMLGTLLVIGLAARATETLLRGRHALHGIHYTSILSYIDWFAAGMAVAYLERIGSGWIGARRLRSVALLIAGLGLFLAANLWLSSSDGRTGPGSEYLRVVLFPTALCAGIGLILLSVCCSPPSVRGRLWLAPAAWVGTISYSMYLYHIGVQVLVQRLIPAQLIQDRYWNDVAQAFLALPPTLALSAAMYYAIERPCLMAMKRSKDRSPTITEGAGAP